MDTDIMELEILLFLRILDELEQRVLHLEESNKKVCNSNCAPYFENRINKIENVLRRIIKVIKAQNKKD